MKLSKYIPLLAEPGKLNPVNTISSGTSTNSNYLPELYFPGKRVKIVFRPNVPEGFNSGNQVKNIVNAFNPYSKAVNGNNDIPVIKMSCRYTAFRPFNPIFLKETAARLSVLELAIDNFDGYMFHHAIQSLSGLFKNMNLPVAGNLTLQIEELAAENKLQEVSDQILKLKKIVSKLVESSQRRYF
jgi:hypothetical protein